MISPATKIQQKSMKDNFETEVVFAIDEFHQNGPFSFWNFEILREF